MYVKATVTLVFEHFVPGLNHFPFLPDSALPEIQLDFILGSFHILIERSRSGLAGILPVTPCYFAPLTILFQLIIADIIFDFGAVSDDRNIVSVAA